MPRLPPALRFALRLVGRFPLHVFAALIAALIAEALLTIQPLLLGAFMDVSQSGAPRAKLLAFPLFMLAAAALSYLYDFIAVAMRYALQRRLTDLLREVYLDFGDKARPDVMRLALRTGLGDLAQLALTLSLGFFLVSARLGLMLYCLSLGQQGVAWAVLFVLLAGLAVTVWNSLRLGRLSRAAGGALERGAELALKGSPLAKERLTRHSGLMSELFLFESIDVFVGVIAFRVVPVAVLVWYLLGSGLSLGSLTSTFLYFSMLRGPYTDLTRLIQQSLAAAKKIEQFGGGLDRGLEFYRLLGATPFGLIWDRDSVSGGRPLSAAASDDQARVLFDDIGPAPSRAQEKAGLLAAAAARSRVRSVCLHSDDPLVRAYAHFVRRDGRLRTVFAPEAA